MATSHEFLALREDFDSVHEFLLAHGADLVARDPETSSLVYHFVSLGELVYWTGHDLQSAVGPIAWKAAVIAEDRRRSNPDVPQINQFKSPIAGANAPAQRIAGVWKSCSLWFPTPKLREVFPALARVNGQFERWLRKHELAFDNIGRTELNNAPEHLCGFSGLVIKVFALPGAAAALNAGTTFVHHLSSEKTFEDFVRQAELRGQRIGG